MTRLGHTCLAALLLLVPLSAPGQEEAPQAEVTLEEVVIKPKLNVSDSTLGASGPDKADLANRKATTGDAADLLRGVPGVSLNGAGGISRTPNGLKSISLRGLSLNRLEVLDSAGAA